MNLHLNSGDIYALLAALCWSSGIILFELSGKVLDSLQMNFLKNIMNNQDVYAYTTTTVTRDYQKYGWPLEERWWGVDLKYTF